VRIDGIVRKGYERSDFDDTWKRFLPVLSATSATRATNLNNKNNSVADVADGSGDFNDDAVAREERAAGLEYDSGLPREVAEVMAANEIPPFLRKRTA
jgi:hypothetical protein